MFIRILLGTFLCFSSGLLPASNGVQILETPPTTDFPKFQYECRAIETICIPMLFNPSNISNTNMAVVRTSEMWTMLVTSSVEPWSFVNWFIFNKCSNNLIHENEKEIDTDMTPESRNIEARARRLLLGNSLLNAPFLWLCSRHIHGNNILNDEYTLSKILGGRDFFSVLPKLGRDTRPESNFTRQN
jgi:hypothetical protein